MKYGDYFDQAAVCHNNPCRCQAWVREEPSYIRRSEPHPTCPSPNGEHSLLVYTVLLLQNKELTKLRVVFHFYSFFRDFFPTIRIPFSQLVEIFLACISTQTCIWILQRHWEEKERETGPSCMKRLPVRTTTQHLSTTNHRKEVLLDSMRTARGTRLRERHLFSSLIPFLCSIALSLTSFTFSCFYNNKVNQLSWGRVNKSSKYKVFPTTTLLYDNDFNIKQLSWGHDWHQD